MTLIKIRLIKKCFDVYHVEKCAPNLNQLIVFSVMILKNAPEQVVGKHLSSEIGMPKDYKTNKEMNDF